MTMDDPKTRVRPPVDDDETVTKADFLATVKALIAEMKTASPADAERAAMEAERLLLEQERLKREMPENKQSPGISVFSTPRGELLDPKPPLKCDMFWVGYPLTTETL